MWLTLWHCAVVYFYYYYYCHFNFIHFVLKHSRIFYWDPNRHGGNDVVVKLTKTFCCCHFKSAAVVVVRGCDVTSFYWFHPSRMKLINHQRATLLLTSFTKWNIYLFYNGLTHVLWTSLLKTYLTNTSWPLRLGHVTIRCQKPCSVGSRPLVVHHCLDRFPISMFVFVVYYCDVNIVVCTACPPWTRLCACACELDHTYLYRHRLHKDLFRVLWFLCWFYVLIGNRTFNKKFNLKYFYDIFTGKKIKSSLLFYRMTSVNNIY